jgi:hypothetical protein
MPNQKLELKQSEIKLCNSKTSDSIHREPSDVCTEMLSFYVRQVNPYSCSVASVAIVLNTILARLNKRQPISINHAQLLSKVRKANWKEKVSIPGFHGKHGLTVLELGIVVKATLEAFDIPYKKVQTTLIYNNIKNIEEEKKRLLSLLMKICTEKNHYIIAHFTQGVYTGDWFGGHISPVGSFDPEMRKVLILDVDEDAGPPYWVHFDIFFEGLLGKTKTIGPREGGYVSITI